MRRSTPDFDSQGRSAGATSGFQYFETCGLARRRRGGPLSFFVEAL
jgi:hypothetical protein